MARRITITATASETRNRTVRIVLARIAAHPRGKD
jgi:hypothetical protein